jgi:hypothetical protein
MYLVILLLFTLTNTQADMLELKDGTLLKGTYVGGTRLRLRFEVQDKVRHIPTRNIVSLTFAQPELSKKPTTPDRPSAKRTESPLPPTLALQQTGAPSRSIPPKTTLSVQLTKALTTIDQKRGSRFTVTLIKPIRQNRQTLLPKDSKIHGRITDIQSIKSGTSKIGLELISINVDNHLYTLTTGRIVLECDGDLITLVAGAPTTFDAQTELGDFIAPSGDIHIPAQTSLKFKLAAPLYIKEK